MAAGPRGAAVKGEEGYAAAGRRGAVVSGEEGYAAVGRNGNVVTGEEVDVQGAAVGRRGAVVVGEEGAAAVGRYGGVVVGDRYESYDAWKAVAAVGAGIAIGTMLAKPPAAATTVVVSASHLLLPRQHVLHARHDRRGGRLPGRAAPAGRDHHDAPGGLQGREGQQRAVHAVRSDLLHESAAGLPGGRPEVTGSVDPRSHGGWRALLPVTLLVAVAGVQVMLATTAGLSAWKGGGFGMFSTTDDGGRRYVRIFVTAPERSEEISIAPSLEDAARRAAVLPRDAQLSNLARRVVERERRYQRPVDAVRIQNWRVEYAKETLAATPRMTREFLYRVDAIAAPDR